MAMFALASGRITAPLRAGVHHAASASTASSIATSTIAANHALPPARLLHQCHKTVNGFVVNCHAASSQATEIIQQKIATNN
jgi:hypothetical protein